MTLVLAINLAVYQAFHVLVSVVSVAVCGYILLVEVTVNVMNLS